MSTPHDTAAEHALLGALLLGSVEAPEANKIFSELDGSDFYSGAHGRVFDAMGRLHDEGTKIDAVAVAALLPDRNEGTTATLNTLAATSPFSSEPTHYAQLIRDHAMRRKIADFGDKAAALGLDGTSDIDGALAELRCHLDRLSARTVMAPVAWMPELMQAEFKRLSAAHESKSEPVGILSGLRDLDSITLGFEPGDFVIVAARPGVGKSVLGMTIAANAALTVPALLFSFEMGADQLARRHLASVSGIDGQRLRSPKHLGASDMARLSKGFESGHALKDLAIVHNRSMTMGQIRARAQAFKSEHGLGVVVIDYLQQIRRTRGERFESREREVADLSVALKIMAGELGCPVVCLAQLNRQSEQRGDKKPMLSDLRESGSLEQDADVVILLHRDKDEQGKPAKTTWIDVAKNRSGDTGSVEVGWDAKSTRFHDLTATRGYERNSTRVVAPFGYDS